MTAPTSVVHLLGRPHIEGRVDGYRIRSRKSWALLAYLLLSERPPTRAQLANLLFDEAEDPLGAVRWGLSEIRRALGGDAVIEGDPVVLRLPDDTAVDVDMIIRGSWADAVRLPGLGSELLGAVRSAAGFESWLLAEQRRVTAASEEVLHEAAMASLSRGAFDDAIGYAVRLIAMTPLDENHHALLIRLYRMTGDDAAARRQLRTCTELLARDLGIEPGPVVHAALRERRAGADEPEGLPSIEAVLESGKAAVSAGAIETGADLLRTTVRLADRADAAELRVTSRLLLAETLIHSMRGQDEEGMATLQCADDIALAHDNRALVAQARAELGYVDFLRGRYDRAQVWLSHSLEFADGAPMVTAKATAYLGSVQSDRGRYLSALALLDEAVTHARAAGDVRRVAYTLSMIGRVHLLRDDLDVAATLLDEAMELSHQEHWLAFIPWPQAMRGEVELARGDAVAATALLQQAFARACRLGDPCWEGMAARGLALVAATQGETAKAFRTLADARLRANRLADPYVWLDGYILDLQCTLGRQHSHPDTHRWIHELRRLASRTGMRELTVRSLLHGAAAGSPADADAARLLAADVDNPRIAALVAAMGH